MKTRTIFFLLTTVLLSGCTSILGGSSSPQMAYIGDLSNNRVARAGETIAYAKSDSGTNTFSYVFKGVDNKGGIHISKMVRSTNAGAQRTGVSGFLSGNKPESSALVYLPEQTLLVSPGVHIVFIRSTPSELHYRVIMTSG